jgi:hypothetical protein
MLDVVKLPLNFDPECLRRDLEQIPSNLWVAHFNPDDYEGDWSALALYSPTGESSFIMPMQTDQFELRETPILSKCPYLQEVIDSFQCPKRSVRLLRLHAEGIIKEHTDHGLSYADNLVRLHIPIQTNRLVESFVSGKQFAMQPGECWYVNFTLPHRVHNRSDLDRVHLVIDCDVNPWLRRIFASLGFAG